jgi:hypothetical protein
LKKRSKKLLLLGTTPNPGARAWVQKFFGSLFQKRTCLLTSNTPPPTAPWRAPDGW